MYNKAVIKDEFYLAFEFIEKNDKKNEMSNFCHAIISLQAIVDFALNNFFDTYIHTFSQEDLEKIKKYENKINKNFDELELGRKMGFLRDSEFIEKVSKTQNKSFVNTLKLRDNKFVDIRNEAVHRLIKTNLNEKYKELIKKLKADIEDSVNTENDKSPNTKKSLCIIGRDCTINQYNLIAAVLNELGFKGYYDYKTTLYNYFCKSFASISNKYVKESTLLSYDYKIDNSLLSEFQFYNRVSGKFESFNFIEDSEHANSGCLIECNCLISGEGGIGKTTILYHIYEYCKNYNKTFIEKPFDKNEEHEDFCPIPIFISAYKFNIHKNYSKGNLKNDITEQVGCEEFSFFEDAEKLAHLCNEVDNNKPFFIFLIDGLNEITSANNYFGKKILNILGEFTEKRIQVIVTSRTNFQLDERYQNRFKEIRAQGLTKEKIVKYIEKQDPSTKPDIKYKLNNRILDLLKNPMLLTLYTGYKYDDKELKKFDAGIKNLKLESKLIIRETNSISISNIFWNYIEYRILFHNIFQPVIEMQYKLQDKQPTDLEIEDLKIEKLKQEVRLKVVSELVPQIAWKLVSQDLFSIKVSDDCIKKIIDTFYEDNKNILDPHGIKKDPTDYIVKYMTNSVGLLNCEDGMLSFLHQNFRDFFAACHYIGEYMILTGSCEKKTDKIREKLKDEFLPPNLKLFVGELLNERGTDLPDSKIDMPLKEILNQYKRMERKEESDKDHTVENIFEIDKALDVLNPIDYFDFNIDKLNFNDVKADIMIAFIEQVLNNVSTDALMSEMVWNPIKKKLSFNKSNADKKTVGMPQNLLNLFMLSARCASNSNTEHVNEYFNVWFIWARKFYKNKTDIPAKKLVNKAIFDHVLRKDRIILLSGPLTNLLHSRLEKENVGTGEKGIFSIFDEVSNSKPYYVSLMNVLIVPEKVKVSEIVDAIYYLASQGGLAPNFPILIMNYYVLKNRDNNLGKELINELVNKMNAEKDEEKKTYIRFRLMSAINYCLQESLLDSTFTKENLDNFKSTFKPIMKHLLDDELKGFSDKTANDYRDFKYGYYFPFGILNAFDNGINENLAISKVVEEIFSKEQINYNLFQKLIFDVACCSTNTFFAQNLEYFENGRERDLDSNDIRLYGYYGCSYLENTYNLFTDLIYKLYPVQQTSSLYEEDDIIWASLTEALGILYYNFPLKTEAFFDSINAHYLKNGKTGENYRILRLKRDSENTISKNFEQLCQAKLKENTFIVKDFIINYRNMWLFADLASNVLLTFETVRESFVSWAENSFYKNIDIYKREPKEFAKQTLTEVLSLLEKEEKTKGGITEV